jgi:hypothetical protein
LKNKYYIGIGASPEYKNIHSVNFYKIVKLIGRELASSIQQKHNFRDGFNYLYNRVDKNKISRRQIKNLFVTRRRFRFIGPPTLRLSREYEQIFRAMLKLIKELNKKLESKGYKVGFVDKILDKNNSSEFILMLHNEFYIKSRGIAKNYGSSTEQLVNDINTRLKGI